MRQELTELPASGEDQGEPQTEGEDDFQAHCKVATSPNNTPEGHATNEPYALCGSTNDDWRAWLPGLVGMVRPQAVIDLQPMRTITLAALLICPSLIAQNDTPSTQTRAFRVQVELLTDPQGVDFRPYLTEMLSTVRAKWYKNFPQNSGGGAKKRVLVEGRISQDGHVTKWTIVSESGDQTMDRAALAILSSAAPFSPLPREFKGDRITVRFAFAD
jgi:TonB family protein